MENSSYKNLKEEERELEKLKGRIYSLEDRASQIMKEIRQELNEIDEKKLKPKKKIEKIKQ